MPASSLSIASVEPPMKFQGPGQVLQLLRARARDPSFWRVQAAVGAIAVLHAATEGPYPGLPESHLHHLAPALFVFPIIHASLRFGREGGLLTGLWCALLTAPNIVLWHRASLEWLVEITQITVAVAVGLTLSTRVDQEAAARRRAQEMAERLQLVSRQVMRAQEDERLRIARELHDDTVQGMAFIGHALDEIVETSALDNATVARLRELRVTVDRTATGVRRFSRDLRPPALDDLGLTPALESLVRDLNEQSEPGAESETDIQLQISGAPRRLPTEIEVGLFRIVQEALSNVVKHAEASAAVISVRFEDAGMKIEVRDDGRGFDASVPSTRLLASGKLGLAGMYERAQLLGATFDLHSQTGAGTSVTVDLSLQP